MEELKPCPFCGGKPDVDKCDRLYTIGCKKCGYRIPFPGCLQLEKSEVLASAPGSAIKEYYHADAWDKAVMIWNRRVSYE